MLFFPNHAAAEKHQSETKAMRKKTALYPKSYQNAQTERKQSAAPQLIIPAHKNTPCMILCRGCSVFNRQDMLCEPHRCLQALRRYRSRK